MGRIFTVELDANHYSCKFCNVHLVLTDNLISKDYTCRAKAGYFFENVVNVKVGEKENRTMTTGEYTVGDIFCVKCGSLLGFKYVSALDEDHKYKEGKFVLQRCKISGASSNEDNVVIPRYRLCHQNESVVDFDLLQFLCHHSEPFDDLNILFDDLTDFLRLQNERLNSQNIINTILESDQSLDDQINLLRSHYETLGNFRDIPHHQNEPLEIIIDLLQELQSQLSTMSRDE